MELSPKPSPEPFKGVSLIQDLTNREIHRIKRIIIVRALPGLGDLLCCVPALRSLRAAFPSAQIDFVGLHSSRWFAERFNGLIDGWIDFPGYPGIPEGWSASTVQMLPHFFAAMQSHPYELALQMHGSGDYINPFTLSLGAKTTAGFYLPGEFCPDPNYFLPYPDSKSEIWRLLKLAAFLGVPLQNDELSFPVDQSDRKSCVQLMEAKGLKPNRFVCIHAGASIAARQWSASGFAQVADWLSDRSYPVVLTGTAAEKPIAKAICDQMKAAQPPVDLTGETPLGVVAALLQQTALVVCNDTGISHLAAALKTPSVVVFNGAEVDRWAPLNRQRHRIVDREQIKDNVVQAVIAQADSLLLRAMAHAS